MTNWTCPFFPGEITGIVLLVILIVWSSVWKAIALWRAGGNRELGWFIALFILNTLGILEIIYIFAFSKKKPAQS